MLRCMLTAAVLGAMILVTPGESPGQATKKLKEKTSEDAAKKSWEQVDQINKDTDGTRGRYEKSRKSAGLDKKGVTGGRVTMRHILPEVNKAESNKSATKQQSAKKKKSAPPKQ